MSSMLRVGFRRNSSQHWRLKAASTLAGTTLVASLAAPVAATAAVATSIPTVTFATSTEYARLGQWVSVSATLSAPIDNTTYFVRLIDLTTGTILRECVNGTSCTQLVYSSTTLTHNYAVHLDSGRGAPPPYPIVAAPPAKPVHWVTVLPALTAGTISFHTNDEDRDHDTSVHVVVHKRDGSLAAFTDLPDSHFDDNSDDGPFWLRTTNLPVTNWDELRGGWLQISIEAFGDDTWRFNYSVRLNFTNGRYIMLTRNGVQMSDDRTFTWPINF